jgi:hypothetical protein
VSGAVQTLSPSAACSSLATCGLTNDGVSSDSVGVCECVDGAIPAQSPAAHAATRRVYSREARVALTKYGWTSTYHRTNSVLSGPSQSPY